jgi:hypothetical protein
MANKIINDYGEIAIAVGYEGSRARIEAQYPKTIEAVYNKMVKTFQEFDGISRHMSYSELEAICYDANITDAKTIGTIYTIAGTRFEDWKIKFIRH